MKLSIRLFVGVAVGLLLIAIMSSIVTPSRLANAQTAEATEAASQMPAPLLEEPGTFPRTVKDSLGNTVNLAQQPTNIVSLSLGADEILLSLVDSSRIVGLSLDSLDPAQSNNADNSRAVAYHFARADAAALSDVKPDIVFISASDTDGIKALTAAKLPVFVVSEPASITDVEHNIILIAAATGNETEAVNLVTGMETKLATIQTAIQSAQSRTVLYYGPDGVSYGPNTLVNDVITRAGGVNVVVASGIKEARPKLTDDFVVKQNPDLILLAGPGVAAPDFVDKFKANPHFQSLKAVGVSLVVVANDAHITTNSQYVVEGAADLAALLYPSAYEPTPAIFVGGPTPTPMIFPGETGNETQVPSDTPVPTQGPATPTPVPTQAPALSLTPTTPGTQAPTSKPTITPSFTPLPPTITLFPTNPRKNNCKDPKGNC